MFQFKISFWKKMWHGKYFLLYRGMKLKHFISVIDSVKFTCNGPVWGSR